MAEPACSNTFLQDRLRAVLSESCSASFLGQLSDLNAELESAGPEFIQSTLSANSTDEVLVQLIDSASVREFSDREDVQFTREDFIGVSEKSEQILQSFHILLKHTPYCSQSESISFIVKKISPKLLHLVAGNIPKNLWTNPNSVKKAKQVLEELKRLFQVDICSDLVQVNVSPNSSDLSSPSTTLYGKYLDTIRAQLTKYKWERNPFAKASFSWLLFHVKFPHLSDYLNLVLPVPLNMVDDFNIENKVLGVQCLNHVMENVSHEELRWYGRAEVVYEALKHQLYTKHVTLVEVLHPAMLLVLKIAEKVGSPKENRDINRCDEVFRMLLFDSEIENSLAMRRALTSHIPAFIDLMGITVVRHMRNVINIVSNYLEIYDGPEEISRLNALKILKSLLITAWPRAPAHAVRVIKCLLKFLHDVGRDKTVTPQHVKDDMTDLATQCLVLLKMVAPDVVKPALLGVAETDTLDFVKNVLLDVCEKKDLTVD